MWNPPIVLTAVEQTIAARTRKARKFFVFLRECRQEFLTQTGFTADQKRSPEPGGHEPSRAGLLALAPLLQGYRHVVRSGRGRADRDGQALADGTGLPWAEPPPSARARCLTPVTHHPQLGQDLLDPTVALAETTGGFGASNCARSASTPLFGAGGSQTR